MIEFESVPDNTDLPQWIYHLVRSDGKVLYVGRTENPRLRINGHKKARAWWSEVWTIHWTPLGFVSSREASIVEAQHIERLKPMHNIQKPDLSSRPESPVVSGTVVANLRRRQGMTQVELAKLAGIGPITISHVENQNRNPSSTTVRKLADALGIEPERLYDSEKSAI